jgi:uncharacterized protein
VDASNLPLLELFTKLQDAGFSLGIDEYKLALKSLQGGFGVRDKVTLKSLCQTLWVKSTAEKLIFEYYFNELIVEEVDNKNINNSEIPTKKYQQWKLYSILRNTILGIFLIGITLAITTSNKQSTQTQNPIPTVTPTLTPSQLPQPTQNQANQNQTQQNWILLILLFIITLTSSYWLFRWLIPRLTKQKFTQIQTASQADSVSKSWFSGNSNRKVVEEIKIDIPFQPAITTNNMMSNHDFLLTKDYLPITQRQMKQIWRYFRRMVREGIPTELDIAATVDDIGRKGLLLKPILIPRRVNKSELILLIDQDGSMVPFGALSHQLIETAMRGGRLGNSGTYYFHNCPIEYLYQDSNHLEAELISNILNRICSDKTAILIFSDAGAARGGYNEERYNLTKEFINQVKKRVRYIAWLNPVPRKRWLGTTASEIASLVPMFEFKRQDLLDTINVLRGRTRNMQGHKIL